MCAWERSGDRKWLDRILTGLEGILKAPYKLLEGCPFDYDPATGAMTHEGSILFDNRLALIMGGAEAWMEMAELIPAPAFRDALVEWGRAYAADPLRLRETDPELYRRVTLLWGNARLVAWAGVEMDDPALKRRAWTMLIEGDGDPREGHKYAWPVRYGGMPPRLSAERRVESSIGSTNNSAMGALNLMACLALAPDELELQWNRR
jgi:hypothetical protein